MTKSRAAGSKLQIESLQLDLLAFTNDYRLADYSHPEKKTPKVAAPVFHGDVDDNKTFANFITGDSNEFAALSIKRFIMNERSDYGIVYLKSDSGLGKSHLLHAAANLLKEQKKSFFKSSPFSMENFTLSSMKEFDFILIDDIEEIESSLELQKRFCQLLDLAESKKLQIIITGRKLPAELENCDERLKGKLSGALIHHMSKMNATLAFEMVKQKSQSMNLQIPAKAIELIAGQLDYNAYGPLSIIQQIKCSSELYQTPITLSMASKFINTKKADQLDLLVKTANAFAITYEDLLSPKRKKEYSLPRHVGMYLLREKSEYSFQEIAGIFNRDHSSVIYAVEKIKNALSIDPEIKKRVQQISN